MANRLFTIAGKDYFEIVLQDEKGTLSLAYEGKREAEKGLSNYRLFILPEYNTYGARAARELIEYDIEHQRQLEAQKKARQLTQSNTK